MVRDSKPGESGVTEIFGWVVNIATIAAALFTVVAGKYALPAFWVVWGLCVTLILSAGVFKRMMK